MDRELAKGLSVGIIMDGNGRWAKSRNLPRTAGHKKGADVFDDIAHYGRELRLAALTFYAFSTENWTRPPDEVDMIMDLFGSSLRRMYKHKKDDNRVVFLGARDPFPQNYCDMMEEIEEETAGRTGMILNVAVNYGGRQELIKAAQEIGAEVAAGRLAPGDIDEACIENHLYTKNQPIPDFILRTSGEQRLSNFLMWQSAYSEFVFIEKHWPEFTRADLDAAILEFCSRDRRYGGV